MDPRHVFGLRWHRWYAWDGTAWHLALSLWGGVPGTTGTSIMACRTDGATWAALTPIARVDDSTARRNLLNPMVERWEQAFRVGYLERDHGIVSGLNFGRWRYLHRAHVGDVYRGDAGGGRIVRRLLVAAPECYSLLASES